MIERDNFRFFCPLTTMVLLSAVLTLILWVFKK
jgi:regulatory protein YycH of two-component signal transduction system YycFG